MNFSKHGEELLKQWEGCKTHIYHDSAGKPTIGIGHLLLKEELIGEKFKNGITLDQAFSLLEQDIKPAVDCVNKNITQTLNQNQFDALVSLTFNIGCAGFASSTLRKVINCGTFTKVEDSFLMWNKVTKNGIHVVDPGLNIRRENEIKLWLGKI